MGCNSQVSDNHGALILCNPLLQVVFTETLYFNLYTGDCRLHIYLQHGYIFRSIHCGLDIYLGVYTVGWIYIQAYTLQVGYIFRRIHCRLDTYLGVYTADWIHIQAYTLQIGYIFRRIHCRLDTYLGVYTAGQIHIQAYTLQAGYILDYTLQVGYIQDYTLQVGYTGCRVTRRDKTIDQRRLEMRRETKDERRGWFSVFQGNCK